MCGDGLRLTTYHSCDDKNTDPNDGCSAGCQTETGYDCIHTNPTDDRDTCTEICGDGLRITAHHACDDKNLINADGCTDLCEIELGYEC
ncbi:hypothetical protein COB52_05845 [Candidatus Kaiserbacteria bacterium]|nr:MAG: hypothetical protein COB52_05845 [Candidatus Kaiserbacteria bacterium]